VFIALGLLNQLRHIGQRLQAITDAREMHLHRTGALVLTQERQAIGGDTL
jgi:hypothetical protein